MALDFGIVTYHVTSYLSICSRNLASSARRRRQIHHSSYAQLAERERE
jgi:hypothetical protein